MNIMPLDLDTIITFSLIAAMVLLIAEIFRLNSRLRKFMTGKSATNLEGTVKEIIEAINEQSEEIEDVEKVIENINGRLKKSIQKVNTIRFNPFHDQGSNQSFATSFLDEEGNGVVISSLYSREKVSVYAKPILALKSEYELSDEEKQAIQKGK
jgi:hypothetical protein